MNTAASPHPATTPGCCCCNSAACDDASRRLFTTPDRFPCDYVMIVGLGRSGTNWLLDLFDLAPNTYCRNEANALDGSPFEKLPPKWLKQPQQPQLQALWDQTIRFTATHMGERDHPMTLRKNYIHPLSRMLRVDRIIYSAKARKLLSPIAPAFRQTQWPIPRYFASREKLAHCLPVLKILQAPGWLAWVLENRPQVHVIHIVRHPGGFLNSYRKRYLAETDPAQVRRESTDRLQRIAQVDPAYAALFGNIDAMTIEELEMWFWRYTTEQIHAAGQNSSRYDRVVYEDLTRQPVDIARHLYQRCGLTWNAQLEQKTQATAEHSDAIASAWREKLPREHVELIDRIFTPSPLAQWWNA